MLTGLGQGVTPGNVVFKLREQGNHPRFRREGNDLHHTMHITLKEALLGFRKSVLHLDGRMVRDASFRPPLCPCALCAEVLVWCHPLPTSPPPPTPFPFLYPPLHHWARPRSWAALFATCCRPWCVDANAGCPGVRHPLP